MHRKKLILFFCLYIVSFKEAIAQNYTLPVVQSPSFKKDTFNIVTYGAVADGITLNTKAISDAINACNKNGGGVVLIPPGMWLTGPVILKSSVNLHLQKNALLQFTKDFDEYKLVEGNWEGVSQMRNQSPVSATDATNVAITGFGIIDGNGGAWRMVKKDKLNETQWRDLVSSGGMLSDDKKTWYPSEKSFKGSQLKNPGVISSEKDAAYYNDIKDFLRPNMILLTHCKKVLLEGVTFQNSPAWNLHPLMCENLTVRNVYAKNPWYAQNGDGIDVESCKNVLIENSTFDVGDDGICIKSGRDEAGRKRAMPTENLLVKNCTVYHAHGGFVIGSEMSGGAKNLYVEDCTFIGTDIGLRFKTTRGRGGVVENVFVKNITMKDIASEAILFDMYYAAQDPVALVGEKRMAPKVEMKPVTEETPQFKNFYVKNIVCDGADKAVFIRGLPEMHIANIYLSNITIKAKKGIDISEATGIHFKNVKLITTDTDPVADILNSNDVSFDKFIFPAPSELLFRVGGERTTNISMANSATDAAKQKVKFEFGANETSLKIN
ncbi:MAG: glycoside hydrolase family 28 protein [Ginsengibacter sp.]